MYQPTISIRSLRSLLIVSATFLLLLPASGFCAETAADIPRTADGKDNLLGGECPLYPQKRTLDR